MVSGGGQTGGCHRGDPGDVTLTSIAPDPLSETIMFYNLVLCEQNVNIEDFIT
jgi:hypothetical protein